MKALGLQRVPTLLKWERVKPLAGLLIGLVLALALTALSGESPARVASVLFKSAFGSKYDLGLTLFYMTSLLFTGLSVFVSFQAGLFNLGGEGQLYMGSMGIVVFALCFPNVPPIVAPWLAGFAGVLIAAFWGGIAGYLRTRRGSHEVVVTMMLNFIAYGLTNWLTLQMFHSETSQSPETQEIAGRFLFRSFDFIANFFPESGVNLSLLLALFLTFAIDFIFLKSLWGFEARATGLNESTAFFSGVHTKNKQLQALLASGALAGLVGWNEILGGVGKFRLGFSPGFGFLGIAVALLAGKRAWVLLPSAFLFAILLKGSTDLDVEFTSITREFAQILQALILFGVLLWRPKEAA